MTDDDKRTFDAYTKLADYWADCYERRRQVEWKISLGFWAVILSGIVSSDKLNGVWSWWFAGFSLLVWLVYIFLWLVPNMRKNERDKRRSYSYVTTALSCTKPSESEKLSKSGEKELLSEANATNPGATGPSSGVFSRAITAVLRLFPEKELLDELNVTDPGTTRPLSLLRAYSIFFHLITTAVLLIALNYILYLHRGKGDGTVFMW
jgi:hypothetical protein